MDFYDRIHRENGIRSLRSIIENGGAELGLSAKTRVRQILTGGSPPVDEEQTAALARALGGSVEDAERARMLFRGMQVSKLAGRAKPSRPKRRVTTERLDTRRDSELDDMADQLAQAMTERWLEAADDRGLLRPAPLPVRWCRSSRPVVGKISEATAAIDDLSAFDPLPGMQRLTAGRFYSGGRDRLLKVYGGLPSGRLLITGGAGSGKSSVAIHLLLDALRHRATCADADRSQIPVPVMFSLSGWDPSTKLASWLIANLSGEIPLLRGRRGRGFARRLLEKGQISVFLDGLDEMAESARVRALQALSERSTFRLVVMSRTTELADAASRHILLGAAAVELQPLDAKDSAAYLLRLGTDPAPPAWHALATMAAEQPDSPIAQALTSPLDVTLLRDIYGRGLLEGSADGLVGSVEDLLDTDRFPDADAIGAHLRDHAVPAAYAPRPGRPLAPYDEATAQRTLSLIARLLNKQNSRDVAWWTIAGWLPSPLRVVISCIAGMVLTGSCFGVASLIASGLETWPVTWLQIGGWYALLDGMPAGLAVALAFNLTTGRKRVPDRWHAIAQVCAAVVFGVALSVLPSLFLGGWSLSVSTFGFLFAVAYGIANRTRGAAMLRSLNIGSGIGSARRLRPAVLLGLAFGIPDGLFGLIVYLVQHPGDLPSAAVYALTGLTSCVLIITSVTWLTGAFIDGPASGRTNSVDPVTAWRADFRLWLFVGLAIGLASAVNAWLVYDLPVNGLVGDGGSRLADALAGGLAMGLAEGLILGRAWLTTVTQIWLSARHRTPLRLGRFLADSHKRHLLRTVGPKYQFRHATLQDHFANRS